MSSDLQQGEQAELAFSEEEVVDISMDPSLANVTPSEVLRIEEELSASFKGVRSCGDSARAAEEAANRLETWVQEKLYDHRHLRYIKSGRTAFVHKWSNRTQPWPSNKRTCRGFITFKAYVEFKKYAVD